MSNHLKVFYFAVIALCLCAFSPIHADDSSIFAWSKVLSEPAIGLDWSPSGDLIVFGDWQTNQIAALNWQTEKIVWRTTFSSAPNFNFIFYSSRWSPDGKWLAATSDGQIYIIDPQNGQLQPLKARNGKSKAANPYYSVRWGNDSTSLAALTDDGYIDIFSVPTDKIVQTIDIAGDEGLRGESFVYTLFDWSPDGNFLAAPNYLKDVPLTATLGFWDRAGNIIKVQSNENTTNNASNSECSVYGHMLVNIQAVEWANDSRRLAISGADGYGICRLNIDGTVRNQQISDIPKSILRWSPDQRWLAAAYESGETCSLWLSDVANNYQTTEQQIDAKSCAVSSLAWSPDSQRLAAGTDNGIWIGTLTLP